MFNDPLIFSAWQTGLFASTGLIMAIGSQNAFLLSHALRRQHATSIAALCVFIDTTLIIIGVLGIGALIQESPLFLNASLWFGIIFLSAYGLFALVRAINPSAMSVKQSGNQGLKTVLLATLAVSLLNPHVYLDTVLLIGSIGGQFNGIAQTGFIIGACMASLLWFFGLAWGAKFLIPLFANPMSWRCLDIVVCLFMWRIAYSLATGDLIPPS